MSDTRTYVLVTNLMYYARSTMQLVPNNVMSLEESALERFKMNVEERDVECARKGKHVKHLT